MEEHLHQFTQSKRERKKGDTQKDCDRSHESEVYFFRVLLQQLTLDLESRCF
jgi:hypothetical protein